MPPVPIGASSWYGPIRVPAESTVILEIVFGRARIASLPEGKPVPQFQLPADHCLACMHARDCADQFPVGHLPQALQPEPFTIAPCGVEPTRKQRQVLLTVLPGRHDRLELSHELAQ